MIWTLTVSFFACVCVCAGNTTVYETWSKTLDMTVCCLLMNFKSIPIVPERRGRARRSGRPGQCSLPSHHHHSTLTEDGNAKSTPGYSFITKNSINIVSSWEQTLCFINFISFLCLNPLICSNLGEQTRTELHPFRWKCPHNFWHFWK